MPGFVFLNKKFLKEQEAKIDISTPGLLYGWGVFETLRYNKKNIPYFKEHLARLKGSAKRLQIPFSYPDTKIKQAIEQLISLNKLKDAAIRLSVYKKEKSLSDCLITARNYKPFSPQRYKRGFRTCVSSLRINQANFLSNLKTTNYLLYRLGYSEAVKRKFDEALFLNADGYLADGSRSNLFMVKDNQVFTPALECGCLEGITRGAVIALCAKNKISVSEGNFTLQELYAADEAFLSNSLFGIMPLASVEAQKIGRGTQRKITALIRKIYCDDKG